MTPREHMPQRLVRPTRTLYEGQPYRPSWMYRPSGRYVVERLHGHFGPRVETMPEGDAHKRDPGEPDAHGHTGMGCGS